jgi:hypothetical protein
MKKVFVEELQATCQLCDSYQDLKGKEIIPLIRAVYQQPHSMEGRLALLESLFYCPAEVWAQLKAPQNRAELLRLVDSLDWILKGPEFRPVASVKIKGREYLLPDTDLNQLGTAEFVVATAHLIAFYNAKERTPAHLAKFMATIARPKPGVMERFKTDQKGDPREAYNSAKCEARAQLFEKCDLVTMITTAQWFNNAANRMLALFGMASKDPDAAPITQGMFVQDWERQIIKVAESPVFGGYDQVMARPLADVLGYIELKNDEIRAKIAANRN